MWRSPNIPQKGGDNCCEHGITWASSTRGGIGREAAKWFTTGFATKVALARSDGEKWRVRNERKRLLQQHSRRPSLRGATGRSPSATRGRGWVAWRRERRQSSSSRVGSRGSRLSSVLSERPVSVKQRLSDSRRECVVCRADQSCLCLLYTSPSPRDGLLSRMPSSA